MHIGVDGGALCSDKQRRFGTYTFSYNLIQALERYDPKNKYNTYTFCQTQLPHIQLPQPGWSQITMPLVSRLHDNQIFLALNQSIPRLLETRTFSFLHGLSFVKYKKQYTRDYQRLNDQLHRSMKTADQIFVTSQRVKKELSAEGFSTKNVVVLPLGIPRDMVIQSTKAVRSKSLQEIVSVPYLLFVGMDHPIKNIPLLIKLYRNIRERYKQKKLRLILFGPHEKYHDPNNGVVSITGDRNTLRTLYAHAQSLVSVSQYESFHFPILEALAQQCPAIGLRSAIIPEFEPYCTVVRSHHEVIEAIMHQKKTPSTMSESLKKQLKKSFNWQTSVETIQRYYE